MARAKDVKIESYCHSIDKEMSRMEGKITTLREGLKDVRGLSSDVLSNDDRHLAELYDEVESKRMLLLKDCPLGPVTGRGSVFTEETFPWFWLE